MTAYKKASRVNWDRAVAKGMASHKELKTQMGLARKAGVSQSTIGRIVRGEGNTQVAILDRIAKALGLSITKLAELGQEGEPVAEPTAAVLEKAELIAERRPRRILVELELSELGVVSGKWVEN